jgi:hypothetical protein
VTTRLRGRSLARRSRLQMVLVLPSTLSLVIFVRTLFPSSTPHSFHFNAFSPILTNYARSKPCDGSDNQKWDVITAGKHNNQPGNALIVSALVSSFLPWTFARNLTHHIPRLRAASTSIPAAPPVTRSSCSRAVAALMARVRSPILSSSPSLMRRSRLPLHPRTHRTRHSLP